MSNKEILEKAISKAIEGGFAADFLGDLTVKQIADGLVEQQRARDLIFQHDFAKALWPLEYNKVTDTDPWDWHLQQMVIAEDPIKYLGENL